MIKKRIFTLFLALLIIVSFTFQVPTAEADTQTVTYDRRGPEVAILNRYTGDSAKFYDTLFSDSSPYNGIGLFGISYNSRVAAKDYKYDGFPGSTLYQISNTYQNLKANVSGTFHNNWHTHSAGFIGLQEQRVLAYSSLLFYMNDRLLQGLYGCTKSNEENARLGNKVFNTVPYSTPAGATLKFTQSSVKYNNDKSTCTCGGHYVEKIVLAFMDDRPPKIANVKRCTEAGHSGIFKENEEIKIEITYDESIRFADDNAAGKGNLYINLIIAGRTADAYPKAMLTKLENSTLTFSYTVPKDFGTETITGLDLSPLMGSNINLVQVKGNNSFSVSLPADVGGNEMGFTKTTSYITDLAGNAITEQSARFHAYINTGSPFATKIRVYPYPDNGDVKSALGKTNPEDKDYLDKSDTHLGVGDRIELAIEMNEMLDIKGLDYGITKYENLMIETNLLKNGSPIVLGSSFACKADASGDQYGQGASKGKIAYIESEQLRISEDITCADEDGRIRVTGIYFKDGEPFKNLAGKVYDVSEFDPESLPMPSYYLDNTFPQVTTTAEVDEDAGWEWPMYEVTPEGDGMGFRFPFEISDGEFGSGTNGIRGHFMWSKNLEWNVVLPFEYTVTSQPNLKGTEKWQTGNLRTYIYFTQIEGTQYLHLRPIPGTVYNIFESWLTFWGDDYAGNDKWTNRHGEDFFIDGIWDNSPPSATIGAVSRKMETSGGGTITVDIKLQDQTSLEDAFYLWNDGATPSEGASWQKAIGNISGEKSGTVTAMAQVEPGEDFSKHLWIKASDIYGNVLIKGFGAFEYKLSIIAHELEYPSDIINSASLEIVSIDDDGALLFMVPIPDEEDEYFVRIFKDAIQDIFSDKNHSDWERRTVTREGDKYVIGNITGDGSFQARFVGEGSKDPTFSGNLQITALCGHNEAFADLSEVGANSPVTTENITLRLSSSNPDSPDAYTGMGIIPNMDVNFKLTNTEGYYKGGPQVLSSPESVVFSVDLGTDVNGWNFEDVDFDNSYIELENREDGKTFQAFLGPSIRQDVVFPKDDYTMGWYNVNLIMNCKLGKEYEWGLWEGMFIDTTEESKDFGIKSLTYKPDDYYKDNLYKHGMEEEDYFDLYDAVIYLPANDTGGNVPPNILTVAVNDITQDLGDNKGDRGVYGVRAWNVTAGVEPEEAEFTYSTNREADDERSFYITLWDTEEEAAAESGATGSDTVETKNRRTKLGLVKNTDNTIGIQVLNANGKASSVNYYVIHPVEREIEGVLSATRGEGGSNVVAYGELKFTPHEGQSMDGVELYAAACQWDSTSHSYVHADTLEMLPQSDGSYICALAPGEVRYFCYAIDALGNITLGPAEYIDAVADDKEPAVTVINEECSAGNGVYEAIFTIKDDTLSAYDTEASEKAYVSLPMTINLRFDKDHAAWLGLDKDAGFELTVNKSEYEPAWRAEGANSVGVYEVKVDRHFETNPATEETEYYLTAKIKGQVGYREGDGARDFDLIMDVTDTFGNTGTGSAHFVNAENIKPRAYDSGEDDISKRPAYAGGSAESLRLNFNMPVIPAPSWINPGPKYGELQIDAFPITEDGTWDITFSDMFGIVHTQELTLDDVFKEYGLTIDINPTALTDGDVEFTARTSKNDPDGVLLLFRKIGGNQIQIVQSPDWTHNNPLKEKHAVLTENQTLVVYRYPQVYSYDQLFNQGFYSSRGDRWEINITNIGKTAPEAIPRFYFEAKGEEYTKNKVPAGETPGNVKVWYTTSRHVTPTGDTGESFTFKYGGDIRSHVFTYVDDFGHEGSLAVDLDELGVVLTEPPVPYKDENPPMVTVRLYAKRSGSYEEKESFGHWSTSGDITNAFEAVNYVQGYSMKIEVNDESDYKIVVLNTEPAADLSYESAESDTIEGVILNGNTITITKPVDFTVAVVDNAKSESEADKDNYTHFSLKAEDMAKWFDTTVPEAEAIEFADSLYKRTVYIYLSDKADNGEYTDTAVLASPRLEKEMTGMYTDWYKRVFTDNSSEHLVFKDLAGNAGTLDITMAGIDSDKPDLKTIWSPPYVSGDPPEANLSNPTWGPVNTDVTAIVKSSKPIDGVKAEYSCDGENWADWNPAVHENAGVDVSPERITVKFSESGARIRLTVTAPNGKSTVMELFLEDNVIDKVSPIITQELAKQYLADFTEPYAIKVILTPDEPVYCLNAGKAGTLYDPDNPIIITTNQNVTNTYLFADKAGNRTDVTVTTDDIDFTPPLLTMEPEDTSELEITSGSAEVKITADEACTLECDGERYTLIANEPMTLTFDKNGVYLVTASDLAGNNAYAVIAIGNIDKTAPTIGFDQLTVSIRQGSSPSELDDLLSAGVNVWDNLDGKDELLWDWDANGVNLEEAGLYEVPYTVADTAGNDGIATRYVRVFDKNLPGITIDNALTEQNGTSAISAGEHVLKVQGLREIAPGDMEPYELKICKGLLTEGQAKYFPSAVSVNPDGKFTIEAKGFYTIYIITQSRQSYRTLLYVER